MSLSANPSSWMGLCNNAVQLRATASGGTGDATYKFEWIKTPSGKSGDSGGFGPNSAWNWTPQYAGAYTLQVTVRQGTEEAKKSIGYVVPVPPVTLQVTPTTNVTDTTPLSAAVTPMDACIEPGDALKFKFLSRRQLPSGSWDGWKTLQDWGTSKSITTKTYGDGNYVIQVRAGLLNGTQVLSETAKSSETFTVVNGVASLTLSASNISAGGTIKGTVTMDSAPASGLSVPLSSSAAGITVPASVTINAGQKSAQFDISASSSAANGTVTITAGQGGAAKSATLTVKPLELASLSASPTSIVGNSQGQVTFTFDLTGPTVNVFQVPLSISPPGHFDVGTSASPSIGQQRMSMTLYPNMRVTTPTDVTLTAGSGSNVKTVTVKVMPFAVTRVVLDPSSVVGKVGQVSYTVDLNAKVRGTNFTFPVTSSHPDIVAVPATGYIQGGSSSGYQGTVISTRAVATDTPVTITAGPSGGSSSATLTVKAPRLRELYITNSSAGAKATSTTVVGGSMTKVYISALLDGPPPAGGVVVSFTTSNSAILPLQASLTVVEGQGGAHHSLDTLSSNATEVVTVTASAGGVTKTGTVTIEAKGLSSLVLTRTGLTTAESALLPGNNLVGIVKLNAPAPAGGLTYPVTSSRPEIVQPPATITINQYFSSASFSVPAAPVTTSTPVTITVGEGAGAKSQTITVVELYLSSVIVAMQTLTGGSSTTGAVVLNGDAGPGGFTVPLSSSNSAVTVPASVTVPQGSIHAAFSISTASVTADARATITAGQGTRTATKDVLVRP
ncbi:MAG TPA: hypothetical protein VMO26_01615 [Vicinamibacterales bacterium]|nr:hypothetical protein [Vicinamibacterales bacterium]